jgi:large repetitive protein
MTLCRRSIVGLALCVSACAAEDASPPAQDDAADTSLQTSKTRRSFDDAMFAIANTPRARVISRGESGKPRLLLGAKADDPTAMAAAMDGMPAAEVARAQLVHNADTLQVSKQAASDVLVEDSQALPGGAQVVRFKQRIDGIDVFRGRASVVLDAQKNLVSLASSLAPAWKSKSTSKSSSKEAKPVSASQFKLSPESAVARAYGTLTSTKLDAAAVSGTGDATKDLRDFTVAAPSGSARVLTATAKRVFFPEGDALQPAYQVELEVRGPLPDTSNSAYSYVISARDGRAMHSAALTQSEKFTYRVWAANDALHTPTEGPFEDLTPHPTGKPEKLEGKYIEPVLVETEGFNKNPSGAPDPWLEPGATYTFGNNVNAYSDRNNGVGDAGVSVNNGYDEGDVRADVTGPNTFDRAYDPTKAPDADDDQIKAAVTQIFYVVNWLHDYFYDSGFNEASGNAQLKNYGRGGEENDPLLAEAQDSADTGAGNNANMSTLADGKSPRMQMYVWNGAPNRQLTLEPAVEVVDGLGAASYGPETFSLGGYRYPLVLVNDGSTEIPVGGSGTAGTVSDGCQPLADLEDVIAVIDRGQCPYVDKVQNAEAAGAKAVLILNNAPGNLAPNPSASGVTIGIPVLALSLEDGAKVKAALSAATEEEPVVASTFARGAEVKLDGTIDNTIVAHEWGHYIHHRLVLCGQQSCGGMSEGFGDFLAVMLTLRDGDKLDNTAFPMAQYATAGSSPLATYYGIRRAPYSTSTAINPFTFKHIRSMAVMPTTAPLTAASPDPSEVHNVGEIWAETLFEAYVNVLTVGKAAGRTFEDGRRRMADYLVAGLKAAPTEPTFSEQRDAILGAAYAIAQGDPTRADDFLALARGFAKRGLGVGAVSPPVTSVTLDEAVESSSLQGQLDIDGLKPDDSVASCDNDGKLDSGESGKITVRVNNTGWTKLENTRVKLESEDDAVEFENAGVVQVPEIAPFGYADIAVGVRLAADAGRLGLLKLSANATNPDAFVANATFPSEVLYNYDDVPASSSSDDVESEHSAWTLGPAAVEVWERQGTTRNHFWHGADIGTSSDESLVSPDIVVRESVPFIINFTHRYSFELNPSPSGLETVPYDGAVLEVSEDGGATWRDISGYVDPGYTGTIFAYEPEDIESGSAEQNVLANRKAWAGASPGYPAYTRVSLDLGTQLAGQTIKLRFRIGTDGGAGAPGWDLDDISFGGNAFDSISNTPFGAITPNAKSCQ